MQAREPNRSTGPPPAAHASARLVARFPNLASARTGMRELIANGAELAGRPVASLPRQNRRFQLEKARWGLFGATLGALVGAVAAGLGLALGGGAATAEAAPSVTVTLVLIGALMVGTLGLIAGFACGEPRATQATTEALRAGEAEGEVAVRFDVPEHQLPMVADALCRLGALEVEAPSGPPRG